MSLSERTADLSSVIRSYRNLIHPGRAVRLDEAQPNATTGTIAIALVELIIEEVAQTRKAAFGLTAEQIASKIERDAGSLTILKHLLDEMGETEKERLLLDVLPNRYFAVASVYEDNPWDDDNILERIKKAYRMVYDSVEEPVALAATAKFVEILKSEDGDTVSTYASAFFRGVDIDQVAEPQQPIVKEFLLGRLQPSPTVAACEMLSGFEGILDAEDVLKWVDPIVRALHSSTTSALEKRRVREYFAEGVLFTQPAFDRAVEKRLDDWEAHFRKRNDEKAAELVSSLKTEVPPPTPPTT